MLHQISLEGRRQSWQDNALVMPGTDPSTHTLEGHLLYLNALVSKGAKIRDLIHSANIQVGYLKCLLIHETFRV